MRRLPWDDLGERAAPTEDPLHPTRLLRRLRVLRELLEQTPPPPPRCFEDTTSWHAWLAVAVASGAPVLRRADDGRRSGNRVVHTVFREPIRAHCRDCTLEHARRMALQQRCELLAPITTSPSAKESTMLMKSPTEKPLHLALTSSHAMNVGLELVEKGAAIEADA